MHPVDHTIVILYILGLLTMGFILARQAGKSSEDYFLGRHRLPWWALGASGMSSNLDVAGTMTIVTMVYLYGLHGFFIEMRGGVVLPIAIFLAFMGKWHRRSEVMTTAEWMILRFGNDWQGKLARVLAAATYLILTIGMTVFFLSAGGIFLAEFLPFTPTQCLLGMALVAFIYTMLSGLYGVIWTDVFQSFLIGAAALYIAFIAFWTYSPEIAEAWPGAAFNTFVPRLVDEDLGIYSIFWFFLLVWVAKAVLEGLGGSGGSAYMAQRFYAARSDAECSKIGVLWTLLFSFRWPMVLGIALLAIHSDLVLTELSDAERVLPLVLQTDFFPIGVQGLVLAAMLAAAMSTFDSTINAGASYVVKDIYEVFRPNSTERQKVWTGYIASFLIVMTGVLLTLVITASVVQIWVAIVLLLFPAFLVPFALRWFWSRFNGCGFSMGILGGFLAALWFFLASQTKLPLPFPSEWHNEATQFLAIAFLSFLASVGGTFLAPELQAKALESFYAKIRPSGWWPLDWKNHYKSQTDRQDWLRLAIALPWQILTFLLPMGVVLHMWASVIPAFLLWVALGAILWRLIRAQEREENGEGFRAPLTRNS